MVTKVTDTTFDAFLQSDQTVLLDFSAAWCGPCKMLNPVLEEISEELTNLTVGKLDVDENPQTTAKYGVMGMPTLLVFRNGEVIGQTVGFRPKEQLVAFLNDLM